VITARALAITAGASDTHSPGTAGAGVRGIGAGRLSRCPRGNSPGPCGWHAAGRAELPRADREGGARRFRRRGGSRRRRRGGVRADRSRASINPEPIPGRLRGFSVVPGAAYGCSACSASAVISGTLMSGVSTGGMAIASTGGIAIASTGGIAIASTGGIAIASAGGMASGPAADGRPSMAASALTISASPKSASDGESSAAGPAGVLSRRT
jgi:hypothetical protein